MASIGHVVVGLALARAHESVAPLAAPRARATRAIALSVLALAPDLDVVAFALGIPYAHPLGHRGASHSIVAALVIGLVATWPLARALRVRAAPIALACVLAVLSHPLLDMLTDGGLGCALYWPFSAARHFFPIQPLPVAPIGPSFLSARGLWCIGVELIALAPLLVAALWPRRAGHRSGRRFGRKQLS